MFCVLGRRSVSHVSIRVCRFFIPEPLFKKFCKLFAEVDDSAVKLGGEGSVITISKTDRLKDKVVH